MSSILLNLVYDPFRGYHWLPHDGFHLHLLDFKGVRLSPHDKHFVVSGGQVVDLLRGLGLLRLSLERLWRLVQETNLNEVLLGKYLNPTVSSVAIGLSYKGCRDRKLQGLSRTGSKFIFVINLESWFTIVESFIRLACVLGRYQGQPLILKDLMNTNPVIKRIGKNCIYDKMKPNRTCNYSMTRFGDF